jgi:hypothetical protein
MNRAKTLLAAGLLLAITFTLSCSSPEDEVKNDPTGNEQYLKDREDQAKYYDPDDANQRCQNRVTEWKCGENGTWYNPTTNACTCHRDGDNVRICKIHGVLESLCWIENDVPVPYNRGTQYCKPGAVGEKEICGDKYYEPDSYTRCQNEVVQGKCGEDWYDAETQYCEYNTQTIKARELCGNLYIRPDYQRCSNKVVEDKCDQREEDVPYYNKISQRCILSDGTYTVKELTRCGG